MPELPVVAAAVQGVADRGPGAGQRGGHRRPAACSVVIATDEQEGAKRVDGQPASQPGDIVERAVGGQLAGPWRARRHRSASAGSSPTRTGDCRTPRGGAGRRWWRRSRRPRSRRSRARRARGRWRSGCRHRGRRRSRRTRSAPAAVLAHSESEYVLPSIRPSGKTRIIGRDPVPADQVVHPGAHAADAGVDLGPAGAAVQQVVDGVAVAARVVAGRQVDQVVELAVQGGRVEVHPAHAVQDGRP